MHEPAYMDAEAFYLSAPEDRDPCRICGLYHADNLTFCCGCGREAGHERSCPWRLEGLADRVWEGDR